MEDRRKRRGRGRGRGRGKGRSWGRRWRMGRGRSRGGADGTAGRRWGKRGEGQGSAGRRLRGHRGGGGCAGMGGAGVGAVGGCSRCRARRGRPSAVGGSGRRRAKALPLLRLRCGGSRGGGLGPVLAPHRRGGEGEGVVVEGSRPTSPRQRGSDATMSSVMERLVSRGQGWDSARPMHHWRSAASS